MQTGRIKIVLLVDGHWAYNTPIKSLKEKLATAAHKALAGQYDKLEPIKLENRMEAQAWPEQHDDP